MRALVNAVLAAALVTLPAAALPSEFVIVAHPSVSATALSRAEASRIFLRLESHWPEGGTVRPVDQAKSSPQRAAFSRDVLGKTVAAVEQYWVQAIFSGRAVPPVEKRSDADVLAYVRETPGAVGYVSPSSSAEGVKRLALRD